MKRRRRLSSAHCYCCLALWAAAASPSGRTGGGRGGLPAAAAVVLVTATPTTSITDTSTAESEERLEQPKQRHLPLAEIIFGSPNLERFGDDVDSFQEQKQQQKWAFIPHHPTWPDENNNEVDDLAAAEEASVFSDISFKAQVDSYSDLSGEKNDDIAFIEDATTRVLASSGSDPPVVPVQEIPAGTNRIDDADDNDAVDVDDDRTLLDLFAESAKEYLTTKLIPPSDLECRWDWRSLRCEPSCLCQLQYQWGDYHVGRSCRMLPESARDPNANNATLCDTTNLVRVLDQPVPKRFLSLVGQTGQILAHKATRALLRMKVVQNLQRDVCDELWETLVAMDCADDGVDAPKLPERTLPERLLCGPPLRRDGDCQGPVASTRSGDPK